jgi:hypothetical protein
MDATATHLRNRLLTGAIGLAAFLPLLLFFGDFSNLYWFHDDWDMLDGAARLGLWRWLLEPFLHESVIPVSKLLWYAAVRATGGSYFAMIALVFVTHAANVWLFGEVLHRQRFPAAAIFFALATFALPWTNLETLGWAMQFISVVAITFFLAGWLWLVAREPGVAGGAGYAALLAASALSSSRGIVSGLLLALFARLTKRRRWLILASLAPAVAVIVAMMIAPITRHHPPLADAAMYALRYWLLNPLYLLLPLPHKSLNLTATLTCGAIKLAILGAAWIFARNHRPLLAVLLCLDLLTAGSLGFARSDAGLDSTVSQRYQYLSLFCFGPFAGLLLARCRRSAVVLLSVAWVLLLVWPWNRHSQRWGESRGTEVRQTLETAPGSDRLWPAQITVDRARDLVREYHLH